MKKALAAQLATEEKKVGFEVHSEPLIPAEGNVELSKFHSSGDTPTKIVSDELPISYGSNTIFLIAQEPRWLFTYWDIDISRHPGGAAFLRCITADGLIESEIEVPFETRNWYIPISRSGSAYSVELGYYRGSKWNLLAQSATVQTPSTQSSSSDSFDYATIPLHLSFQQLLAYLQASVRSGENLIQALAKLQKEGPLCRLSDIDLHRLSSEERMILELILGKEFLDSLFGSLLNPAQLQVKIQQHLEKRLNSLSISEILAESQRENTGNSFFSACTNFSNASLSSWSTEALSSLEASETSSWSGAAPFGAEAEQEFFMHVNAEVVFYGAAHPGSSVIIDSKPVKLNPDGSFRFHLIFPDGAYEIPVVATSPDGLETRAAVLRFHRTSTRPPSMESIQPPPTLGTKGENGRGP